MSYVVTRYPHGTFCWTDVTSTNIEVTKKFLTGLFGWTTQELTTDKGPLYTMFLMGDKMVAGGAAMPPDMKNMPSMWNNYVKVDSVDDAVVKAQSLGAKITMPAMDVMEAGRMAGLQDPTGAYVMVWQPKTHIGAQLVNTIGAMGWNELYTKDVEKAKDFYSKLFGWTFEADPKGGYITIKNQGRMNGGVMAITPEMMNMPPCWMVYFTVAKMDDAVKRVTELGGKVMMTKDIEVGKIAAITEPAGAAFMIIEMSTPPQEWTE